MIQNYKTLILQITAELLWWTLMALFAFIILISLQPVLQTYVLLVNAVIVLTSLLLLRYFIFFHQTPYLKPIAVRFILGVLAVIFFFQMLKQIQDFYEWFDTHDYYYFFQPMVKNTFHHSILQEKFIYFRQEFIFFSTAATIMLVLFVLRLIASLWPLLKGKNF